MTNMDNNGHNKAFNLDHFRTALEIYGGNLERFPADQAKAADELLKNSSEARLMLEEASTLDHVLKSHSRLPEFNLDKCQMAIAAAMIKEDATSAQGFQNKGQQDTSTIIEFNPDHNRETSMNGEPANDNFRAPLMAASFLAASLLFGVFLGSIGITSYIETSSSIIMASNDLNDDIFYIGPNLSLDNELNDF